MRVIFAIAALAVRGRFLSYVAIAVVVMFGPFFRKPNRCTIFQFALSPATRRVFDRFNPVLGAAGITDFSLNGGTVSFWSRLKLISSGRIVNTAARALALHRHANSFVQCQQVIGCASMLVFNAVLPSTIRLVCVANDHFPASMALLAVARLKGIATCYFQHAPVTEYFPPLDHDLSVLFDRATLAAYARGASRRGLDVSPHVVILPPFEEELRMPKAGTLPFTAGVCLSLLPNVGSLEVLLDELASAASVVKIGLRRHPRCRMDLSTLTAIAKTSMQPGGESATLFFRSVDFVLVPSSGVAIESLHSGIPTFYTPGVDELEDDYYGFVEDGIVPVFDASILTCPSRLTEFFDDEWKKRFGLHDETVHTSPMQAKQDVLKSFERLLL